MSFENLTPDKILNTVEAAMDRRLTGVLLPLPSYINRVYELQAEDGAKLVVKFYRPGRWDRGALADEHQFMLDCVEAEIPVVPPMILKDGLTMAEEDGITFAVFPKRAGRRFEITEEGNWRRLGALVARLHNCGSRRPAENRVIVNPLKTTASDVGYLCKNVLPERFRDQFRGIASQLIAISGPWFEGLESIRIHNDCHCGNILDRLEDGLLLIDFDDMAMGPPVQDMWLLLPDRAPNCSKEIERFLEGYEQFREFNRMSLRCIEPLRAMRMIYFVAWCSRQKDDFQFKQNFPDWGSTSFWQKEINDLREQLAYVMEFPDGQG